MAVPFENREQKLKKSKLKFLVVKKKKKSEKEEDKDGEKSTISLMFLMKLLSDTHFKFKRFV